MNASGHLSIVRAPSIKEAAMKTGTFNIDFAEDIKAISIDIARGGLAPIQNGRGMRLSVEYGSVWITQSGSIKDVCLGAGKSFCIDRDGLTLVNAVGDTPRALVQLTASSRIAPWATNRSASGFRRLRMPWRSPVGST
jgi:Protein of unknown function (DUF2917)